MIKKISIALVLLTLVASSNAVVLHGNSNMISMLTIKPLKASNDAHSPSSITPQSSQYNQSSFIDPQQYFVAFSGQSKTFLNQTANNADNEKLGHDAEVTAVPVPAALPLVATVLGIYGIARRRKTFK